MQANSKKWFVYILSCKGRSFYIGITSDIERRFQEHREGRGGRYTLLHNPIKIVYLKYFNNKQEALRRERQLKGWSHKKKENLVNSKKF